MQDTDGRIYSYRGIGQYPPDEFVYLDYDKESQEFSKPEIYYFMCWGDENSTEASCSIYTGYAKNVVIPEKTLDGKTVTSVYGLLPGYRDLDYYNEIESILIPKTIKNIEEEAIGYYSFFDGTDANTLKIDHLIIKCYKDSAGEKYAIKNGFNFELID